MYLTAIGRKFKTVQLQRSRNYDDELQHFNHPNPKDAPQWTFVEQYDMIYDTDIEKTTDVDLRKISVMNIYYNWNFDGLWGYDYNEEDLIKMSENSGDSENELESEETLAFFTSQLRVPTYGLICLSLIKILILLHFYYTKYYIIYSKLE
ncbi:unnamed protein product [Rhizophagus irregularis]|nr:unnamed protein product [Rhizophagus irregularis]